MLEYKLNNGIHIQCIAWYTVTEVKRYVEKNFDSTSKPDVIVEVKETKTPNTYNNGHLTNLLNDIEASVPKDSNKSKEIVYEDIGEQSNTEKQNVFTPEISKLEEIKDIYKETANTHLPNWKEIDKNELIKTAANLQNGPLKDG